MQGGEGGEGGVTVGVFVLLVSHGKENGGWEIGSRLRETEAEDAVDAIEIGRVTVRDDTWYRQSWLSDVRVACRMFALMDAVHDIRTYVHHRIFNEDMCM